MIPYTTPTETLTIDGHDLTQANEIKVSVVQGCRRVIHKAPDSVTYTAATATVPEKSTVTVTFTQNETAKLRKGQADIQVNWMIGNSRLAVIAKTVPVNEQLYKQVMGE